MIIRIVIILACVVVFINSCNSLVSQHFGTHKLRTYAMEEAVASGIGDADFIELKNAYLSGDFVFKAAKSPTSPGVIIYPVLSASQMEAHEQGRAVSPDFIAWTTNFPSQCVEAGNCIDRQQLTLKGIVRELPDDRQGQKQLEDMGYAISEQAIFVDHGQEPLAWYWNLLLMAGAALLAFLVEMVNQRMQKRKTP